MLPDIFPRMVRKVPPGQIGRARVEHFEVTGADVLTMELMILHEAPGFDKRLTPGRFARLWVGKHMMMADTHPERVSCLDVVREARGHVLIAGLGLGMILWPIAAKPEVESITVLERYRDVIRLVRPHIPKRVRVVNVDAFRYRPRHRFHTIFLDIWPLISPANLLDMLRLERRYRRFLAAGGWMKSWQREVCERMAREELEDDAYKMLMGKCGHFRRVPRKLAAQLGCHE
jgi:hypothetical protein